MTLTLHLGVIEVPYEPEKVDEHLKQKYGIASTAKNVTTGDVAEILEAEYHPMEIFAEIHIDDITNALETGLSDVLEAIMSGAPTTIDPFGEGTSKIEDLFKNFLSDEEMERVGYPGVPTAASGKTEKRKGGINHRLKHPYAASNPARPSFIDTGLYQSSFKAWVD